MLSLYASLAFAQTGDEDTIGVDTQPASDLYVVALSLPQIPKPVLGVTKNGYCSCVNLVKQLTGFDKPVGLAKNWPINSDHPTIGGVVITKENPYWGHVAFIKDIVGETLFLDEANYYKCQRKPRELDVNSPLILGFWSNDSH